MSASTFVVTREPDAAAWWHSERVIVQSTEHETVVSYYKKSTSPDSQNPKWCDGKNFNCAKTVEAKVGTYLPLSVQAFEQHHACDIDVFSHVTVDGYDLDRACTIKL